MHILIIGAGLVGVTTAWECHRKGYEVTLVDAADAVAAGASRANGGQIAVTDSAPWSTPGLGRDIMRDFVKHPLRARPYRLRLRANAFQWGWLYRFWRNCRAAAHAKGAARNHALAQFSQKCLADTRTALGEGLDYDGRQTGLLKIFGAGVGAQAQDENWLDAAALVAQEPALRHAVASGQVTGAVWRRQDESGNAAKFTHALAAHMQKQGVKVQVNTPIVGFETRHNKIIAARTPSGKNLAADGFILAAGTASRGLAKKLGLALPILPVKGYSLTVPILDAAKIPTASLTDARHRLVITRLGDHLRAAGFAEIGMNGRIDARRIRAIRRRLMQLFPDAADYEAGQSWAGFRPMTPDSAPIIGAGAGWENLWLNSGHGMLGWTLAHGTARLLAAQISGAEMDMDISGFAHDRAYY